MSETEELTKQVDLVYKNLLDKFNPAARQLITAGKAYLKALHGAMAASKVYLEALTRVARHSQQGLWGGSSDIGMCLMQMVDVYKEVQSQQMNILKAFYVDLLVPLETNLDKDTKVLQSEQKKFLSCHKHRLETYTKAAAQVKKQKKKNKGTKGAMDKEIKQFQALEEEKCKMDGFVEQSLQNAVTQERRRYGFILERQCSLAKHYLAFHTKGSSLLQHSLDNWQDISKTREGLPDRIQAMLPSSRPRDEGIYSSPLCLDDDNMSVTSQMRKARSVDASCQDLSTIIDEIPSRPMTRARSEYNLTMNHTTPIPNMMLRRSMAVPEDSGKRTMARALYSYLPSGDNQLCFTENDLIALIGEKNKGWQYGENLRTQRCGWFPVAYTEIIHEEDDSALGSLTTPESASSVEALRPNPPTTGNDEHKSRPFSTHIPHTQRYPTMHRSSSSGPQFRAHSPATTSNASTTASTTGPQLSQPPTSTSSSSKSSSSSSSHVGLNSSHETLRTSTTMSSSANTVLFNPSLLDPPGARVSISTLKKSPSQPSTHVRSSSNHFTSSLTSSSSSMTLSRSFTNAAASSHLSTRYQKRGSGNSSSFHSSDDSGFSNESGSLRPPVNPEADYSDDDINGFVQNSMKSLSSRWVRSQSMLHLDGESSGKFYHTGDESILNHGLQYFPDQDATKTLPTPGRKRANKKHRDLSLPPMSIDHFVTIARRKTKKSFKSPCAQKIAAQRERSREQESGRKSLRRSSSLLCLGMDSCHSAPDDGQSAEYEDVWSEDWRHSSLVDINVDIPEPPPFSPPEPPTTQNYKSGIDYSIRPPMPLPHDIEESSPNSSFHTMSSQRTLQNSSSGNSTLTGSEEEDEEIYMVVSDHRCQYQKSYSKGARKQLSRSLTWASPANRASPPTPPPPITLTSMLASKAERIRKSRAQSRRPDCRPTIRAESCHQDNSHQQPTPDQFLSLDKTTPSPPIPPKKKSLTSRPPHPLPHEASQSHQHQRSEGTSWHYSSNVNIFNYSDFMNKRLKCPEGISRIDQQSFTSGNLCGPWYDLWADDPSVADV
ncbi:uncharacterized protein IRSp53 isoform X2 [Palaemon carinicauda]|uniref:uncharacterized protein IRSp53 isoform X2 n=1 Tax=Palaemon carinicauda TaxID=392227 RepID=UPI0035B6291D